MRLSVCLALIATLMASPIAAKSSVVVVADDRMVVNGRVHFQTGNAVLAKDAASLLDDIAAALADNADIDELVVEGHTDSVGDPEQNRALSLARAQAVVDALVARGVAPGRLIARGFGDAVPLATNDTAAGRERNRRVEFNIIVRAGQVTAAAKPLASIAARFNVVDAKAPQEPAWQRGDLGLPLYRAWRVNTKERSSADVAFRDTSRISLRETTLIVIFGDNAYEKKEQRRATLESGSLVSRIDELLGGAPLTIDAPSGTAELRRGRAVVSSDATSARVSNHRGDKVVVRGKTKKPAAAANNVAVDVAAVADDEPSVEVNEGMGTRVLPGQVPEPPRPLPLPPTVASTPTQARWQGDVSVLSIPFTPPEGATDVLVEMRSADGTMVFQARAPGTVRAVEARGLPMGTYTATLSVLDAIGLESVPVEATAVVPPAPPPVVMAPKPAPVVVEPVVESAEEGWCSAPLCPIVIGAGVVVGVAATVTVIILVGEANR